MTTKAKAEASNPPSGKCYEVAIVGFGPAGAVAACWLGQFGIKTLVVEKSREIYGIPRAIALDHEIMRVFQNLGVVEEILPHTAPFPASEHFGVHGQLIRTIHVVPPPYPQGYIPTLVFTQPAVEAILRRHAAAYPDLTVWLAEEVIDVRQHEGHVCLNVRNQAGELTDVQSRYVVACDGALLLLDEIVGHGWRLVIDGRHMEPPNVNDSSLTVVAVGGDGLEEIEGVLATWFEANECAAALIRPDHYVFGVVSDVQQIPELLNEWRHMLRS